MSAEHSHGTRYGYQGALCRCTECRKWNADRQAARRLRRAAAETDAVYEANKAYDAEIAAAWKAFTKAWDVGIGDANVQAIATATWKNSSR